MAQTETIVWVAGEFHTSLGHSSAFDITNFHSLLRNAIDWAADRDPPAEPKQDDGPC